MNNNEFKLNINDRLFTKYFKLILMGVLLVTEILVCAQYATQYMTAGGTGELIAVVACCATLTGLEIINSFAVKKFALKIVFYTLDTGLLLALCALTGNTYLPMLYCIILTQFYVSVDEIKLKTGLFVVSCALYIVSFVSGWVVINNGASLYESIVQILGDCFIGIFILVVHFIICTFILKFYAQYVQLKLALKEADENKAQLKDVYEQLSHTAVFEERNRIAKDIHDNAGHSMTTVIMQTEAAKLLIDTDPDEAKKRIISANMQAKNALEQMRESVHLLAGRNSSISLKTAIEEIIAQTIDGTELKIRCDLEDVRVGEEEYRFLCNSVKECLANGIRHGGATAFYIEMKNVLSNITLLISDNGCGVKGEPKYGFGLKGIVEKAEALGGSCEISGEAGEGFEVEITLPYRKIKE
ncbi:MAG: sensor histidine kinase [Clostridia bacterium]|nr:sensor histidine kinase [Clostridia bacterium]